MAYQKIIRSLVRTYSTFKSIKDTVKYTQKANGIPVAIAPKNEVTLTC
jgi:hypothetical protein